MNFLVKEAIQASKASRKNDKKNFSKIKRQFWKIINRIKREEIQMSQTDEEQLHFHMIKMK